MDAKTAVAIAIEESRTGDMVAILSGRPDLLAANTGCGTWMHYAATLGNLDAVMALRSLGIGVNAPYPDGHPPEGPLYGAIIGGHFEVARWLIEHGAKSNCRSDLEGGVVRNFALGSAIGQQRLDLVRLLVEGGADVNCVYQGESPLDLAGTLSNTAIYQYLAGQGAVHHRD